MFPKLHTMEPFKMLIGIQWEKKRIHTQIKLEIFELNKIKQGYLLYVFL